MYSEHEKAPDRSQAAGALSRRLRHPFETFENRCDAVSNLIYHSALFRRAMPKLKCIYLLSRKPTGTEQPGGFARHKRREGGSQLVQNTKAGVSIPKSFDRAR